MKAIDSLGQPSKKAYCITHVSIDGAVVGTMEHQPKADMYVAYFPAYYKWIYAGHYHRHQHIKHFTYIGSLTPLDRSDAGQDKGVILLTPEGNSEFLVYNGSPHFVETTWSEVCEGSNLDNLVGNFVDLTVDTQPFPAMTEIQKVMNDCKVRSFQGIYTRAKKDDSQTQKIIQTSRTAPKEAIRNYVVSNKKSKRFTAAGVDYLDRGKKAEK